MTATIHSSPEYALGQNDPDFYPPTVRATRHLIGFLQWRFSLLPAGSFHWAPEEADSPDIGVSEILISQDTPLPTRNAGMRPAITVLRSQLQFTGTGIGDMVDHSWGTGGKTRMDMMPTTLCVNVLSRLPVVAERLAWFVQDQVFSMREEIVRTEKCIFAIGQRSTIAPPSPAGALVDSQEEDWSVVPIFMPTYLQHVTSSIPLNRPILKGIETTFRPRVTGDKR